MVTVRDEVRVRAPLREVFRCVWDATLWPELTDHVRRIEMLGGDDRSQQFRMTVESNGRLHTVESERKAEPGQWVSYRQTRPPVFLLEHSGDWRFAEEGGEVTVHLEHRAEVDYPKALEALGVSSAVEADERVSQALKVNGSKTLLAIKRHLEAATH